jgi:superoxide dismutase, Cu-Zn family
LIGCAVLLRLCSRRCVFGFRLLAKATLTDANGKVVGEVNLIQTNDGVLIRLSLKGVPAGDRAFHVQAVGKCIPPFTSAGSQPGGQKAWTGSGRRRPCRRHAKPSHSVQRRFERRGPEQHDHLGQGGPNSVFDADGSAIVAHAMADDYKTDPAGNAGDRIACGVITD